VPAPPTDKNATIPQQQVDITIIGSAVFYAVPAYMVKQNKIGARVSQ
jgi:hypothetical protein